MNEFKKLLQGCGLSHKGASRLIGISYDVVKNWSSGRTIAPPDVLMKLMKLERQIGKIFGKEE